MICNFDVGRRQRGTRGQAISTDKECFFEGDIARRRVDPAQWFAVGFFERVSRCLAAEESWLGDVSTSNAARLEAVPAAGIVMAADRKQAGITRP